MLVCFFAGTSRGVAASMRETVDRVVASIGNLAVTQAEVDAEYRFEMFLDGKLPPSAPDRTALEQVRDRLIEQKLLAEEAGGEGTQPANPPASAAARLEQVRQKFASQEVFQSALRALGMDEQQALARITDQENLLRVIDQRFRPMAWPERGEIEAYYRETFLPEFAQLSKSPPPPLNEVENRIRDILVQKKINDLLEKWLEEMKSSRRVKVYAF